MKIIVETEFSHSLLRVDFKALTMFQA